MTLNQAACHRRAPRATDRRDRRAAAVRALLVAVPLLALAACGKKEAAEAPVAAAQGPVEGAPQIVTSADGVHIEYHVYGDGDPAVVLIHGWSCDGNYWKEQIAPLKAKYTTVVVDLAGHGAS